MTHLFPAITFFHNEYAFLSNFYAHALVYEGIVYPTSEHAYQAAKTLDPVEKRKIRDMPTPGQAKRAGKKVTMRPDWDEIKYNVMLDIVRIKFKSSVRLQQLLEKTGNMEIEEGNTWGDKIWGKVNGEGLNWLGKILMQVRQELRDANIKTL